MKISYNWLKSYVPEIVEAEKLTDVFTYHLCEVENIEKRNNDVIFDINILPNRAHDLLSHFGVARELASLLNIKFIDPILKCKVPESKPAKLKIEIKTDKCRRYAGRIIKNVKVNVSPEWMIQYLESIGQRSINNIVDAANIVMYGCGQPTHAFDLDKVDGEIIVRDAKDGEKITTLDNKEVNFKSSNMVIADSKNTLAIAGIKGGKIAEVNNNTKNIILEVANFDPTSVRKTAQALNIFTDARKRYENDLSPELVTYAMIKLSALILEMCPKASFEEIVDVYPQKQEIKKLSFSADRISKILGLLISQKEIENILKRYNFEFKNSNGNFEIVVPSLRLDLTIEEDMAEEIGRILGYDKIKQEIPKINLPRLGKAGFKPKINEIYTKINFARNKLLNDGYSEVMTYIFRDKGEVEVLASASDKKFLRTNLTDSLKESLKLNQLNAPLLGMNETRPEEGGVKIFEIGTIFKKSGEEMHVAYADKKNITEVSLNEFCKDTPLNFSLEPRTYNLETKFKMWSLFPFIARDVAVWVPASPNASKGGTEGVTNEEISKIIKENMGNMIIKGPELFDEFKKGNQISYAFRLIFQSYERTLTDKEINDIMTQITNKIKDKKTDGINWQVR